MILEDHKTPKAQMRMGKGIWRIEEDKKFMKVFLGFFLMHGWLES